MTSIIIKFICVQAHIYIYLYVLYPQYTYTINVLATHLMDTYT